MSPEELGVLQAACAWREDSDRERWGREEHRLAAAVDAWASAGPVDTEERRPSGLPMMPLDEFQAGGYLQEVNRRFLHPLGLALAMTRTDGALRLSGVWDSRDDPEGIYFVGSELEPKAAAVRAEEERRRPARLAALGYWVQPAGERPEDAVRRERDDMARRLRSTCVELQQARAELATLRELATIGRWGELNQALIELSEARTTAGAMTESVKRLVGERDEARTELERIRPIALLAHSRRVRVAELTADLQHARAELARVRQTLAEVLARFSERDPVRVDQRTGWATVRTIERWRAVLAEPVRESSGEVRETAPTSSVSIEQRRAIHLEAERVYDRHGLYDSWDTAIDATVRHIAAWLAEVHHGPARLARLDRFIAEVERGRTDG